MKARVIARRAAPFDPMTHAIFAEAMRVMDWAYDWGEQRLGEGLVTVDHDFDGWNPEFAKFNGPPPRVGDVIRLSGAGVSIVVKRAIFDRGWKVEIGLAVTLEVVRDETIAEPAQPRSYRFDYKPGEWREPEQVCDESALASLEGKPFMTALPFPRHPDVFLDWNLQTGVAVMTGPEHLFEPEHLTPGGRGTLGDEVLVVVEVKLIGIKSDGSVTKVTAQRGTST